MMNPYPLGKLPAEVLAELLAMHSVDDPSVVVGPGVGLDCAVLDLGDRYLLAKTDPITFATERIGWYAVHVNANDIACNAGKPRWFLATVLLPEGRADRNLAKTIFEQITEACEAIGASLVGGHTEITYGIDRPIVIGSMLGEVSKEALVTAAGAQEADAVLLTKGIPIETISILAREKEMELRKNFDDDFIRRAQAFLTNPGISVLGDAAAATRGGEVHAMHDPTEGGLATGLWELAEASHCHFEIDLRSIPVYPEGEAVCATFGLDPLASIASGALLLTTAPEDVPGIQAEMNRKNINCTVIGRVKSQGTAHVEARTASGTHPLGRPERDEITRLFE